MGLRPRDRHRRHIEREQSARRSRGRDGAHALRLLCDRTSLRVGASRPPRSLGKAWRSQPGARLRRGGVRGDRRSGARARTGRSRSGTDRPCDRDRGNRSRWRDRRGRRRLDAVRSPDGARRSGPGLRCGPCERTLLPGSHSPSLVRGDRAGHPTAGHLGTCRARRPKGDGRSRRAHRLGPACPRGTLARRRVGHRLAQRGDRGGHRRPCGPHGPRDRGSSGRPHIQTSRPYRTARA